jgi:hypothetical protein
MPSSPAQPIVAAGTQLGGSEAVLYTAPTGFWVQIMALRAVNVDTGNHTVSLGIVPSGGSYSVANLTTDALALLAGNSYLGYNEYGLVLAPGDSLVGFADTGAKVNILASGLLTSGT